MIAHIIHDYQRTDRYVTLYREIEQQQIHAKFFPAVIHPVPCTAISRAHKNVIRYAIENNIDPLLILEDDVKFTAPGAYHYYLRNIPEDFDIYFGGVLIGKPDKNNQIKKFAGTHCWMINKRFFKTILDCKESINIDTALQNKGKYILCNPMVATVYDGISDRTHHVVSHAKYWIGRTLYA